MQRSFKGETRGTCTKEAVSVWAILKKNRETALSSFPYHIDRHRIVCDDEDNVQLSAGAKPDILNGMSPRCDLSTSHGDGQV